MNIKCSVYPSNLVEPVKVNSKYVELDPYLNKSFKDKFFYEELSKFNEEMLRELDISRSNYSSRKDKSYENYSYLEKVYNKHPKMLYENDKGYEKSQLVKSLIPKRTYFIQEINKK
jgi:hypothetical protein